MQVTLLNMGFSRLLTTSMGCLLLGFSHIALANGTLTHLSGQVSLEKPDGTKLEAQPGMQVLNGSTIITGEKGFVRIEMSDGGEMVLRPGTHFKIEKYNFDQDKPADDSFVFSVVKGGFRAVSGLVSKRGNKDAYQAKTPTAVIAIRGTQFDLRVCQASCGSLPDGTYVAVRFGVVATGNVQGSADFKAGQVGFIPPNQPPVILPRDPGVGFTPPATIPKLDEKKKQENTTKAESNSPTTTSTSKPTAANNDPIAAKTETKPTSTEKGNSSSASVDSPATSTAQSTSSSGSTTANSLPSATSTASNCSIM